MMIERGKKILSLRFQRMKRTTHLLAPLVAEQWNCSLNSLASNDAISRGTSAWFIKCIQPFSIKSIHTTFKIHTYIHLQEMPAALPYHLWRLHTETQASLVSIITMAGRMCKLYMWLSHTHTKCILLWPHWFKNWCWSADTSFCCILCATAMLLLMRHAGSHEAAATSALSSSGMRGGSAARPGHGNFLWGESYGEWEGQTQSQQLEKRPNYCIKCLWKLMIRYVKPSSLF